jgi:hypothetical protein
MRMIRKILAGSAGLAAIAAAAPAAAQYGYAQPYGSQYANPYGSQYGYGNQYSGQYGYGMNTQVAAQQCTAAVQSRLYTRNGLGGILGSLVGSYGSTGRVVSITQVRPSSNGIVRVRGLASSGRTAYGYGNGYPDLSFKCDVDYRGAVRNVSINRR